MLRGATIFSFCLLLILRRRRFRQGRENLAYSLLAATAATPIHQVMAIELAVWTAIVRRLQLRLRGRKMDKTGRSMNERRVAVLSMMETSTSSIQSLHGDIELQCEQHLGCNCNFDYKVEQWTRPAGP
jgi:hypothetical protein